MKKLLTVFGLFLFFSAVSLAANTDGNQKIEGTPQELKKADNKREKYDFSLFKFITPDKKNVKTDSLKKEQATEKLPSAEETTILQEKPFDFFRFS